MPLDWNEQKWTEMRERLIRRAKSLKKDPVIMPARFDESDLVQETCAKANRTEATPPKGAPLKQELKWLFTVQDNILKDLLRKNGNKGQDAHREIHDQQFQARLDESAAIFVGALPGDGPSPSGLAQQGEEETRLRSAIDRLPERERKAIQMRFFEDLKLEEIAKRLSIDEESEVTAAAVSGLITRATKRLQDDLDP